MNIYEFTFTNRDGQVVSLADYKGKVILIVNTATGCGFTPQYEGLENLYKKYHEQGLEILDFPCNQFGNQAPGSDNEIHEFCTLKYNTSFDQFAKIDVNGENESDDEQQHKKYQHISRIVKVHADKGHDEGGHKGQIFVVLIFDLYDFMGRIGHTLPPVLDIRGTATGEQNGKKRYHRDPILHDVVKPLSRIH